MEHPISELMGTTMSKIREMVDVNTIIGNPITTPDGTTIIPVSKVSFGFASGGSDFQSKNPSAGANFGGGSGAGVTINPIAFLIVSSGNVRLIPVNIPAGNTIDRVVDMVPELIDKVKEMVDKKKPENDDPFVK